MIKTILITGAIINCLYGQVPTTLNIQKPELTLKQILAEKPIVPEQLVIDRIVERSI